MAKVTVEIDAQAMRWLNALAVVRDCSIEDLLQQGMRHLKISQTERQRVSFYLWSAKEGTHLTDLHH